MLDPRHAPPTVFDNPSAIASSPRFEKFVESLQHRSADRCGILTVFTHLDKTDSPSPMTVTYICDGRRATL
jgi:hypothetical protein